MDSQYYYLPLTPGLFSILVLLVGGLIVLIQLHVLRYAYMRLGVGPGGALFLLFGSLIGSYFNIPITILPGQTVKIPASKTPVRTLKLRARPGCKIQARYEAAAPHRMTHKRLTR